MSSTQNIYTEVHFDNTVPVYIPNHLMEKIRYTCRKIKSVEWSGVLLYRTSGKFGSRHFKCHLEDFFHMDMGDETYTEFFFNEGITGYLHANQHLRGCILGQIHSHHTMPVFFSPEDMDELHTNADNHNFYLSLIINNREDIIARVCFLATRRHVINTTLDLLGEGGNPVTITTEAIDESEQVLGIYECNIIHYQSGVSPAFEQRCEDVVLRKKKAIPAAALKEALKQKEPRQGMIFMASGSSKSLKAKRKKKPASKAITGKQKTK